MEFEGFDYLYLEEDAFKSFPEGAIEAHQEEAAARRAAGPSVGRWLLQRADVWMNESSALKEAMGDVFTGEASETRVSQVRSGFRPCVVFPDCSWVGSLD